MKHRNISIMALAIIVLSTSVYAADGHDHGNENNAAPMGAGSLSHGHDDKLHFSVKTPGTVEAAWTMIDDNIKISRRAIQDKDTNTLHEAGERLVTAVATLHDHPQAVKEENGRKLTQALDQISKTVDRFHHAMEDQNSAATSELIDLFQSQVDLVKSLYPSVESVEP
jgi:hypothetical protein